MPRSQEVTAYYIRTTAGECFFVDTLQEALYEFLGSEGYRLTLNAGGHELIIRRTSDWSTNLLDEKVGLATLIYREK